MWKSVIFYFFIAIYKSNDDLNMGTNVQKNHPPFNSAQNIICDNILPCRYDFMFFSAILSEDPHSRLLHMTTTPLSTPLCYSIEKIVISAFFLVITILSEDAFVLLCRPTKNKEIKSCSMHVERFLWSHAPSSNLYWSWNMPQSYSFFRKIRRASYINPVALLARFWTYMSFQPPFLNILALKVIIWYVLIPRFQ